MDDEFSSAKQIPGRHMNMNIIKTFIETPLLKTTIRKFLNVVNQFLKKLLILLLYKFIPRINDFGANCIAPRNVLLNMHLPQQKDKASRPQPR